MTVRSLELYSHLECTRLGAHSVPVGAPGSSEIRVRLQQAEPAALRTPALAWIPVGSCAASAAQSASCYCIASTPDGDGSRRRLLLECPLVAPPFSSGRLLYA